MVERSSHEYDLYISDLVLDEAGGGDAAFAALRHAALAGISKHAQNHYHSSGTP